MKYLEIIELCCAQSDHVKVEKLLRILSKQMEGSCSIYQNGLIETDFSVHLRYEKEGADACMSVEGEQVASALRAFGMVNHSVWIQHI